MRRRFACINESRLHAAKNDVEAPLAEFDSCCRPLQQMVVLHRGRRLSQYNNLTQVIQEPLLDAEQALGASWCKQPSSDDLWLRLSGVRVGILFSDFRNVKLGTNVRRHASY